MKTSAPSPRARGFTLLELVLAMLVLALIIGMVFGTARQSLALGNAVVQTQNEEMLHQSFFELLSRRFAQMPGNTRFDLKFTEPGGQILSDLTLQKVPLSFSWGGDEKIAKAVQLSTVRRRDGFLDIVLKYYENEILEGSEAVVGASRTNTEPFAQIVLLEDVNYFEWRVLDGRTMEWQYDWDIQGRLPLQIELKVAFGARGDEIRQVFWVTPKQNPEVLMRQQQNTVTPPQGDGGGTGGGTGGGAGVPGGGGIGSGSNNAGSGGSLIVPHQ